MRRGSGRPGVHAPPSRGPTARGAGRRGSGGPRPRSHPRVGGTVTSGPSLSPRTKPGPGSCQSAGSTTTGWTSCRRRSAALRQAALSARRSGVPTTSRSMSAGAGPRSPSVRAAQDPNTHAASTPSTSRRASATTAGGPNVLRTRPVISSNTGLSAFARTMRAEPIPWDVTSPAASSRDTSRWALAGWMPTRRARSDSDADQSGCRNSSAMRRACPSERNRGSSVDVGAGCAFTAQAIAHDAQEREPSTGALRVSVGGSLPVAGGRVLGASRDRDVLRHRCAAPCGRPAGLRRGCGAVAHRPGRGGLGSPAMRDVWRGGPAGRRPAGGRRRATSPTPPRGPPAPPRCAPSAPGTVSTTRSRGPCGGRSAPSPGLPRAPRRCPA